MVKGRFGGDAYKPHQLGPEPATLPAAVSTTSTQVELAAVTETATPASSPQQGVPVDSLKSVKVNFSSRVSYPADQQLKAMAKEGRSTTELLAEALNLLFKKHGLNEVA